MVTAHFFANSMQDTDVLRAQTPPYVQSCVLQHVVQVVVVSTVVVSPV